MSLLQKSAELAMEYKALYENGGMSGAEYKELIESLNLFEHIQSTAEDLEQDMLYRQIIMGALQIASAVG